MDCGTSDNLTSFFFSQHFMKIPISYTFRSLWTRKLTTSMTIMGVTLVVFVFAAVLMLSYGVEKTLVDTGYDNNVIALRKASQG